MREFVENEQIRNYRSVRPLRCLAPLSANALYYPIGETGHDQAQETEF